MITSYLQAFLTLFLKAALPVAVTFFSLCVCFLLRLHRLNLLTADQLNTISSLRPRSPGCWCRSFDVERTIVFAVRQPKLWLLCLQCCSSYEWKWEDNTRSIKKYNENSRSVGSLSLCWIVLHTDEICFTALSWTALNLSVGESAVGPQSLVWFSSWWTVRCI